MMIKFSVYEDFEKGWTTPSKITVKLRIEMCDKRHV